MPINPIFWYRYIVDVIIFILTERYSTDCVFMRQTKYSVFCECKRNVINTFLAEWINTYSTSFKSNYSWITDRRNKYK